MEEVLITFNQAKVEFSQFCMKPVTMQLPAGYIIGIEGKNGAGKTTLINMMLGRYAKMNGNIVIDGYDVIKDREKMLAEVGFISEERVFYQEYNVLENEKFFMDFYPNWDSERYRKMLNQLNVSTKTKTGDLSKGNRIKFQMAFVYAYMPKLIIMDEPTGGLDPVFRLDFVKWMQNMVAEYGTTIILSTHLQEELEKITDYLIHVADGECTLEEVLR